MCVFVADTRQVLMQLFFSVFHGFVVRGCRRTGCNALRYSIEARLAGRHAQARVVESAVGRETLELVIGVNLIALADEVAQGVCCVDWETMDWKYPAHYTLLPLTI